jgi:hypothetical protein
MIDPASAKQVLDQYKKHGWALRRVLLSSQLSPDVVRLTGEIPSKQAPIDGFWFSRRSRPGCEAWELRRLSGSPFALVQVIEDGIDPETFEEILRSVEDRIGSSGPVSH